MVSALVIIDYQNIHLMAHDLWAPEGTPKHETLIHPLHYANQVIQQRDLAQKQKGCLAEPAELAGVAVFRGQPSNRHSPTAFRRSSAQRSEWTRDRRVEVTYRPLKYHKDNSGEWIPQEKGVDVLIALRLVRAVREGAYGLMILASHDTDLEPAVDEAKTLSTGCLVETTGWQNAKRLRPSAGGVWHTFLGPEAFVRSRDRKDYT